jgi:hypothetical protein
MGLRIMASVLTSVPERHVTIGVITGIIAGWYVKTVRQTFQVPSAMQPYPINVILADRRTDTRISTWQELLKHLVQHPPNPPMFSRNER